MRINKKCFKYAENTLTYDNTFLGIHYREKLTYDEFFGDLMKYIDYKMIYDIIFNYDTLILSYYEVIDDEIFYKDIFMTLDEELLQDNEFIQRIKDTISEFELHKEDIIKHIKDTKDVYDLYKKVNEIAKNYLEEYLTRGTIQDIGSDLQKNVLSLLKTNKKHALNMINKKHNLPNKEIVNSLDISQTLSLLILLIITIILFPLPINLASYFTPLLICLITFGVLGFVKNRIERNDKINLIDDFIKVLDSKIKDEEEKTQQIQLHDLDNSKEISIEPDYFLESIAKNIEYLENYTRLYKQTKLDENLFKLNQLKKQYEIALLYSKDNNIEVDKKYFILKLLEIENIMYIDFYGVGKEIPLNLDALIRRLEYIGYDMNIINRREIKEMIIEVKALDTTEFNYPCYIIEKFKKIIDNISSMNNISETNAIDKDKTFNMERKVNKK